MRAIEIFRKNNYKQRYNSNDAMIYDLRKREKYSGLPDTILFRKGSENVIEVEFSTDDPGEFTYKGTFCFELTKEMLQAISMQIEEIEEKLSKK